MSKSKQPPAGSAQPQREESPKVTLLRSSDGDQETARDQIFQEAKPYRHDFEFGAKTASVFDDMVSRSVPFYGEMQRMTCELSADFAVPGTGLYDLGCATGTTLRLLHDTVEPGVSFVGIDNSEEMLSKARDKLGGIEGERQIDLVLADLNEVKDIKNASVAIMLLTLQFIRPLYRERVIKAIYDRMNEDGCLIIVEKTLSEHSLLNRMFIKYYYEMKRRNGYSEVEISQKREALENVLIPYRAEENVALLKGSGFRQVDEFFRWYNFSAFIAIK